MTQENELFSHVERRNFAQLLAPYFRGFTQKLLISWDAVEQDIGAALPMTYKELSEHLPAGFLGSGISWMSPISSHTAFRLDSTGLIEAGRMTAQVWPEVPLYPKVPGYLVFAQTSASIDWAYKVEPSEDKPSACDDAVTLIDWDHGVVEKTGVEVHELVYRSITNKPKLSGKISGLMHKLFFSDHSFPLFRPV